ncbi:hypothetical protein H1230_09940 [Paenibacillus sp. 19GGS1-52]|nr:hypothetical protein [Paenibacillus sp. 19GGS1-52]ULO09053.1 hypothetical protein H1230_09940 [Paenibacillus sp. 19GGS1-52]
MDFGMTRGAGIGFNSGCDEQPLPSSYRETGDEDKEHGTNLVETLK